MYLTGIKDGVILYLDKNESLIHHFDETYDESIVMAMLGNLAIARDGMRNKKVPEERVCKTNSCVRAKACPVRKLCFKNE
jgi:hypothetical protein